MKTATARRITLATIKSFVRKSGDNLQILVKSRFDGMTDCCQSTGETEFTPALPAERTFKNNLGIQGLWLVLGSRDSFSAYSENGFTGYRIYNCCGSFVIAVADEPVELERPVEHSPAAGQKVLEQLNDITDAAALLRETLGDMTATVDPNAVTWGTVSKYATVAELARNLLNEMAEV